MLILRTRGLLRDGVDAEAAEDRGEAAGARRVVEHLAHAAAGCRRSGKLDRARSRLYRSQILQENMRLKALAEIYTMHSFAQLCNLNFL